MLNLLIGKTEAMVLQSSKVILVDLWFWVLQFSVPNLL